MELFLLIGLAGVSSIIIGYLGTATESGLKQAKRNPQIEKTVSTILLSPVVDKLVEVTDAKVEQTLNSFEQARDKIRGYIRAFKWTVYGLLSLGFLILVIRVPPFLILGIFGVIIFFILKLDYLDK